MAVSWPMVHSYLYWVGLGTETVGSGDKRIMLAVVSVPEVHIALHNCRSRFYLITRFWRGITLIITLITKSPK